MITASQLLTTFEHRKRGWESGLLKYDKNLYLAVCSLVEHLKREPSDAPITFAKSSEGFSVFLCQGAEIGRFPINEEEKV